MSSASASASRTPDKLLKRAPVVYGKRTINSALRSPSPGERERSLGHDTTPEPQQDVCPPTRTWDGSRSGIPDESDPFGFRRKLKELDEQFDRRDAQSSKSPVFQINGAVRAGPAQVKGLRSVSMGTATLSTVGRLSSGRASLSPSLSPLCAISAQEHPPDSSPVYQHTAGTTNSVPPHSEVEEPNDSSSVSSIRHSITTPHSCSAPTPPTSGEIQMVIRKTKGKGKTPVRDALPLVFDSERPPTAEFLTKSKKGRRCEPPKTKAPTKKERREAAFESSRIIASRPVEVLRTQEQKHTLSAFFAGLRRDHAGTPTFGTELPSDPIERFSSPTDKSTQMQPANGAAGTATGFLNASACKGTVDESSSNTAHLPAAVNSDDEMPSVASIIQRTSGRQQRLQEIKQVALRHVGSRKIIDNDSEDDDLLIVKDDMHSVAREEAVLRGQGKAHGSPIRKKTQLRRTKHPRVCSPASSPRKLWKQELQELAKPSFAPMRRGTNAQLSKNQLDQMMIMQHTEKQLESIKRQEEEWVRKGGKLSRGSGDDPQASLLERVEEYAEKALMVAEIGDEVPGETSADDTDEDYIPGLRDSASSGPTEEDDMRRSNMTVPQDPQPLVEDDDGAIITLRRYRQRRRNCVVVGSDDEEVQQVWSANMQRESTSSMESQTEDENDKENSAKLMYDRGEDKENKASVRHEPSSSEPAPGSRLGSLHAFQDDPQDSLSSGTDFNETTGSPKGDVRSPLKDISKDEDDPLLSPQVKSSFTSRLLQTSVMTPPQPPVSTLGPASSPALRSGQVSRISRLSVDFESIEKNPSGSDALQPPFLARLQSQVSPEPSLTSLNPVPNSGFSQFFSVDDRSSKKSISVTDDDDLSLTLDVRLKPALEVSSALRQRAETIFVKEQEYVAAAAMQQNDKPKELYVNDHGFLTQTRLDGSSSQIYRMTPTQTSKFIGTQIRSSKPQLLSARRPLRTLSFTASQELSPEGQPLRRLRKRSLSPSEQRVLGRNSNAVDKLNAFSILGKTPKPPSGQIQKYEKSEFVVVEAEESDEDDMFGFGGPKKDDEEEEGDEQDKVVEGLVDDTFMDVQTEAADLVQEKYREHEEEDDQRLQKLHEDVIQGKYRTKRRDRGVGFEDGSDEDDDEDERRVRQRMPKKRRIEGDNLEALGQNEETKAFYNTYHQDLIDEDDEFAYLRGDHSIPPDIDYTQKEEPEERETISTDEIRQRVREMARNDHEVAVLDPEDTNWVDQSMKFEGDDTVRVKVVKRQQSKAVACRANASRMDFDVERATRLAESEQEREQMSSWAKNQNPRGQGTGRLGNTAAVTGHTTAKSGCGSLRSSHLRDDPAASVLRKTKTSSLLSLVSNRSGRFV